MDRSALKGFVCLLGLLLAAHGCGVLENPTELDVHEQLMIVAPQASQAGPAPAEITLEEGAMDAAVEDAARIEEEVASRLGIIDHRDTSHVIAGQVVAKKAFLFDKPPVDGVEPDGPRFRILTRVTLEVQGSYREVPYDTTIDFWHSCGLLDEVDWVEGAPMGCSLDIGVVFEVGDLVLVALRGGGALPDGKAAYMLSGNRKGATFLGSGNENERAVAEQVMAHVDADMDRP